jgi:hypothetical protein
MSMWSLILAPGTPLKTIHTFTVYGAPPYILTPIAKWLMIASTHNLTQDTRVVTDTVELQYTTPAVGSRSRRTLHTHTDTLARSRFATPLNIRFPRCDIQSPLDGPTSVFSSRKACLQGSRKAPGKLQESSRKAPGSLHGPNLKRPPSSKEGIHMILHDPTHMLRSKA